MAKEKDIAWAKEQLQFKQKELDRIPKKEDFDEVTRSRIKAFLGPWPRALEAAGLKEPVVKPEKSKKRKKSGKAKDQRISALRKLEKSRAEKGDRS